MQPAFTAQADRIDAVVTDITSARANRNTVLIIDDLFSSRLLLGEIIRQIDSRLVIELFESPLKALEYAGNNRVDLVLTDYKMPDFDGIEFVRRLRTLPHCVDVPIVVITVVEDRRIRYQAFEAGATDFLIKPIDEHEAKARCANLLELRRHKLVLSDHARLLQHQVDKAVEEIHERELETLAKLAKAERRMLTRAATYAKRFAAKEACAKALGTGFRRGVFFRDMGVVNLPSGQPTLALTGGAASRLAEITPAGLVADIHLTMTDDHPWAQAMVLIMARPPQ